MTGEDGHPNDERVPPQASCASSRIVAQEGSLPDGGVKVIEEAIAEAYDGWSDAQRGSIWYETDSGMTDDDDDESMCNTSFNGIGYALQVEMLGEVTRAAWQDADELRKAGKRSARKKSRGAEQGL